MEDIENVRL